MCGRFVLAASFEEIQTLFAIDNIITLTPQYNIAPSQLIWAVWQHQTKREVVQLRWGFIPPWQKKEHIGSQWINARAETLEEKILFKDAFKKRRCLIIASGFYEWKTESGSKQPYYITQQNQQPFALAGLWSHWEDKAGESINSCAIITTNANSFVKTIHARMPVILAKSDFAAWLDPNNQNTEQLKKLLLPSHSKDLAAYPVSKKVNRPTNDYVELIANEHT